MNKQNKVNKKYYILSAAIILVLLVFVFIDMSKGNYYKKSVEDTFAHLILADINVSNMKQKEATQKLLEVNVVFEGEDREVNDRITVRAENLLDDNFLKLLNKHQGPVVIVSDDLGLAAHAWVILTRKGYDNLKIRGVTENEMLKYTFEPEKEKPETNQ